MITDHHIHAYTHGHKQAYARKRVIHLPTLSSAQYARTTIIHELAADSEEEETIDLAREEDEEENETEESIGAFSRERTGSPARENKEKRERKKSNHRAHQSITVGSSIKSQ